MLLRLRRKARDGGRQVASRHVAGRVSTIAVMAAKKKPGKNIPNAQRHTVMLLLRLPPDVAERIDELAEEWGITKSGAVARLVEEHDA